MPLDGLLEGLVKDDVELVDGGGREPGVQAVAVEALDVGGGKPLELEPAEGGLDVHPYGYLVAVEGALPHRPAHRALEPGVEVVPDRRVFVVVD